MVEMLADDPAAADAGVARALIEEAMDTMLDDVEARRADLLDKVAAYKEAAK